jgi:hypothetical protein
MHPKNVKSGYNKDSCTPTFIAVLFTMDKLWKQPRCPTTEEWIKKMWYICVCNEMLLSHKEE